MFASGAAVAHSIVQRCGTDAPQSSGTPCRAARTRWCSAVGLTHPGHQARPPCRSTLTGEPARPIRGSCGTDPPQSSGTPSVPHPLRCFFCFGASGMRLLFLAHLGCAFVFAHLGCALYPCSGTPAVPHPLRCYGNMSPDLFSSNAAHLCYAFLCAATGCSMLLLTA